MAALWAGFPPQAKACGYNSRRSTMTEGIRDEGTAGGIPDEGMAEGSLGAAGPGGSPEWSERGRSPEGPASTRGPSVIPAGIPSPAVPLVEASTTAPEKKKKNK